MNHPDSTSSGDAVTTMAKYQSFLDRITDGFTAIDKNWNYIFVNRQAAKLAHCDPNDLIGKNIWDAFPEGINSQTYHAYHQAMEKQNYVYQLDYYAPLDLWFENHIYPSSEGLTVFIKDITDRKKLEIEIANRINNEKTLITATALDAQEKERNAIGVELHDNVNQILVAVKLIMTELFKKPTRMNELMPLCIDNIDKAIRENRRLAHELISPDLLVEDLVDQIERLNISMLKPAGIHTNISVKDLEERLLTNEQKLAVYRIVQEHYSNIITHARASNVTTMLFTTRDNFVMHISDDGSGVDLENMNDGYGLKNIGRRVSVLNGEIKVLTAPNKGFSIDIRFPLLAN